MHQTQNLAVFALITLAFSILLSCGSTEQKTNEAFERVKAEKMLSNDSMRVSNAMLPPPVILEVPKRIEPINEEARFYAEIEKKLLASQYTIKALKTDSNSSTKSLKKITKLEAEQNRIKQQLANYKTDTKWRWEKFKTLMNQDIHKMDIALEGISTKNKQ